MAKKDNFKKAKVSKVKMPSTGAWLTKAGKSVGLAAFDVLKEMMPATADTVASASEAMSDLRDEISGMGSGSDNLIAQKLYSGKESITKATKSILADLKEGNLYKSPGSDMDDFDMSDFDIGDDGDYDTSFESEDGSTKVTTSKAKPDGGDDVTNVNVKVNIGEDSPMVDAVKNQTRVASDSAKAQLEYTKLNDSNMMKSFSSLKSMLRGNLGSIDSNIASVATGVATIAQSASVSLKYYDDSMQMMTNINQNLTAIKDYMTQPKTMAGYTYGNEPNVLDMFTANGGLDISAYMKTVKNQASTAIDNNIILSTIKSIFDSRDMLSSMSPLSMATEAIMKKMVPGLVKQAAEAFDKTLSESAISFLYRLRGMGNNSDNPLLQFLGETFGIDNRYKDRIDKSNYNKGKVDWNGQSHKTLNEVIPYYLRQISSSLSGKEEKVYDYERGIFRDLETVMTEYKERDKAITLDGLSGVLDDFRDYMDNINVQFSNTNMEEAVNKSMERFLTTLVKNNSGGMMQLKDTGDGTMSFLDSISRVLGTSTDDDTAKLIASFFDSNDRSYTMSTFGRKILEARANATQQRNAIEANQTASNAMYMDNGLDAPGKRLNYKKSPFIETDSYGKTPIFYMKNIYRLLAEGIRVFPETAMFGGGKDKPRYYDKVLNEFDNLQTTKKAREAAQNAKSARAMTRQEEDYVKESGGFVVGNGTEVSLKALTAAGKDYQKQLKNDELEEKSHSSLFNKITGLGSDTVLSKIVNKTVEAVNKPSKLLAGVFDYLDNQLFNIVFGGKTGPRGSIVNSAMNFMKNKFAQFSTWLNDKVLTPVYESLFGDDGLINQIKESQIGQSVKEGWQKFKESLFGKEDENGNLVGGMFSEFGNDVKKIGKDLYDRVLGDNPDSFWSGTKRQFVNMFSGITNALGYDLEAARKRREETGKGPVTQMLDDLRVTVKGRFKAWTDALVGEEADPKALTTQLARGLQADMKGMNTSKIGSSAMFGAITSLFLPGGPILHMFLGAGKSFVKQSETMQTLLFGEKDENGERKGRFISKELINLFEENKTGIKIGLGAGVLSTIGILPGIAGGSLMYAVAGGAASFVYNMDSVQEMLFGPKDENGERVGGGFVDRFKKAIGGTKHVKTTGIDAGVGAGIGIVGSLFLPGGPLLWGLSGSILGIAASTDKFKDYMFGSIDKETGKRKGGMLPKMYDQLMGPVKNAVYATQIKAVSWLEERVITPMASAISPMLAQVNYLIEDVRKGIANTVKFVQGKLMDFVLKPAGKATRTIFAPFIKATKMMFKGLLKIVGRVLTSPFNMMKNVGYGLNALHRRRGSKDFKNNTIKNALTFNKEKREKLGLTKEQGKLGNRVKSFAKYYSRKARKDAKFGEKGAWYNKDGMTSRQEQKQRVKESRAWRDYRLKEYKKDKEKRFTNEDRLAFDQKHGYMQWWKKDTAKPKVKATPVDTKKKLAEIQSDKSTVNTKNVILNYTGTLKHKGTGTEVSASEIKGKMATGGTVPSTGVYMLSEGERVIPNDNVAESIKKENLLMRQLRKRKENKRKKDRLKYANIDNTDFDEMMASMYANMSDEDMDAYISRRKKTEKLLDQANSGSTKAREALEKIRLQTRQQNAVNVQDEYRAKMSAYKAVVEIRDILKGFRKRHDVKPEEIKGKKATGGVITQTGAYILSKGEKVIPAVKTGLNKMRAAEEVAYQNIKAGATAAYGKAASVGQSAVSTLQTKAQEVLATGNKYFLDAKGRVLDATEVVKGNMLDAYSKAKAAGGKALEQAKVYADQAKSAGADVLAKAKDVGSQALSSLQAHAQTALQKGQAFITDAKGRVLDAAEVVKGNLSNAYASAKAAGEKAIAQAKVYGNQALSAGKDALASLQAKAQSALQQGQAIITDAKGHVMDAAEVVKGNLTSAYSKAKSMGADALAKAKDAGSNAWNTAQKYGTQALNKAKDIGSQALSTGKEYANIAANKIGNVASQAKTMGTNAWNTAQKYGTQALNRAKEVGSNTWNTAQQYGTQAWNTGKQYAGQIASKAGELASQAKTVGTNALSTAQKYGSQALGTAQKYGSQALGTIQKYGTQALSAGKQYAGQIAGHVGNLATKAQGLGTQALTAAKGLGSQALSAGHAGLSSLASSASALPGMLSTALSGVSLPTVGLAAGGLLAAGAVGLGAKKLYDRHKRKKALQASSITGRMADGGTVKRDGTYILSKGEQVVPVQQNGVARVVINLKDNIAAAKAGRDANIDNTALNKVTQQQAAFMKQQVDQMGQMLDLQRIIRSDIDAEKAYKIEQRNAKKAKKGKLRKTSAKAKLKQAEQLRKAQEKGRYQTLKRLQDEQKEKEKLYKAIFDIKDNTYEMIDKQEKTRIDWKEVFGKKKGLLLLSLLAVVPAILNVVRNYKSIFAKIGQYTSSLSGRVSRSVEMMGGISGMVSRIGDTFSRMVEWFKDPEARKQTFEDFMDNAKNNKEQLKTYAQEAYHKARYGTYKTMEGIKQNTLGGSDTDAYGSKVGNKAKKVGKRAIQRLVTYANTTIRGKRRGKEFMKGVDAYTGADFKRGFTKVKDGIRSGVDNVKGFADDVTGRTAINAQDLINREANKIRTVDVNGKIGSYQYYLNDWKANGQKYLANGDTKLTKEQFQKLYESKASKEIAANADNAFENALDRAYRKYAKQAGANAMSLDEFLAKNAEEFATKMKSRTTGSLDDVIKNMANETTKTKAGKFANKAKDVTSKVNTKLNLKQRLANTVDNIKGTKPGDIVDGVKNKFATIKDRVRPKAVGADDVMLNARDAVAKKQAKVGVKQRLTGAKNNIKNAAGKVGSSMKGFADDVAQNGVKQAGKNAASDMVGKVRSAGTKVAGKVKNIVGEDAAKKAAGYIDDMFKWLGGAIKKVAGKFGASSADNIISKIVTKFSKLLKAGKVFKEFAQRLSKTLVKGAAKLATGLNVIMGVGGGIFGAFDAANLFAVDKENVDVKMRAISALWGSLKNLSIIASVVDLANEILYSVMGISFIREVSVMLYTFLSTPEESDNLDQAMKDFEEEYNNAVSKEYQQFLQSDEGKKSLVTTKDENGNTIQRQMTLEEFKKSGKATTFQEYNNAKHKTVATKIKTAVSGVKDKIVGAAASVAGWKDRKWSELGSGYFNVDEMNEDGTMKSQLEIMKERGKKILLYPFEIVKTAIGSVLKVIDPVVKMFKSVVKSLGDSIVNGSKEMFKGGITHIASPEYWTNPNKDDGTEASALGNIGFYGARILSLIVTVPAGILGSVWKILKGVVDGVKKMGAALVEDTLTGVGNVTSIKDVFSGKYWSIPSEQDSEFSALRKIAFYINRVVMFIPTAIIGLTRDVLGVLDPIIKPIRKAISGITDKIDLDDNGISDLKEDSVGGMNKIIYYTSKFFTIGASIFRGILKKVNEVVGPVINSLKNAVGAIPQVMQESVGKNPFDGDYWQYKAPDNGDGGMLHKIAFYTTKVLAMPITLVVNVVKGIGKKIGGVIGGIVDTAKAIGGDIGEGISYAQSGESMFSNNFWTLTDESGEGIGPLRKILFVVGRLGIFSVMSVINVVKKVKDNIGPIMDTVKKVGGLIASDFKGAWTTTLDSGQGTLGNSYWTMKDDSDEGLGPLRKVLFYGSRVLAFIPLTVVTLVHKVYLGIKPIIDSVKSAIKGVQDALSDKGDSKDGDIRNDKSKAPTPKKDKFSFNALSTIAFYGKKVFTFLFGVVSTTVKVAYTVLKPIITTVGKVTGFILEDLTTMMATAASKTVISKEYWTMNGTEKETGGFAVLRTIMFYGSRILTIGPMSALSLLTVVMRHLKPIIDTAKMLGTALKNDFMSGFETAIKNPLGTLSPEYWTFKGEESTEGLGVVRPIMFYTGRVLMFPILSMYSVLATIIRTVSNIFKVVGGIGQSITEDVSTMVRDVIREPAGTLSSAYWTMDKGETSDNGLGPVRKILFYTGRVLMFPSLTMFTVVKNIFGGIKNVINGIKTVAGYIKNDAISGITTVLSNPMGSLSAEYWTLNNESDEGFNPLRNVLFYAGRVLMFPHMTMITIVKNIAGGIKTLVDGIVTVAGYIRDDATSGVQTVIEEPAGTFSSSYWTISDESDEGFGPLRKVLFYAGRLLMFPALTMVTVIKNVFNGVKKIFNGVVSVANAIKDNVNNTVKENDGADIFSKKYWEAPKTKDGGSGFGVLNTIIHYAVRVMVMPLLIIKSAMKAVSGVFDVLKQFGRDIMDTSSKASKVDGLSLGNWFDKDRAGVKKGTGLTGIISNIIFYVTRAFLIIPNIFSLAWNTIKDTFGGFGSAITDFASKVKDAVLGWVPDWVPGFGGNGQIGGNGQVVEPGTQNGFAYYSQTDPSIRNHPYKLSNGENNNNPSIRQNMGSRGCGPTAMAMVATQLNGGMGGNGPANATNNDKVSDKKNPYSPTAMAKMAEDQHFSTSQGTMPGYFTSVGSQLGMNVTPTAANPESIMTMLQNGQPIIIQGKSDNANSPYTSSGHYVVAVGMDTDGRVKINDPRGVKYSKSYSMNDVVDGSAMAWGFSKPNAKVSNKEHERKIIKANEKASRSYRKLGGYGLENILSGTDGTEGKTMDTVYDSHGHSFSAKEYSMYAAQASAEQRQRLKDNFKVEDYICSQKKKESKMSKTEQQKYKNLRETAYNVMRKGNLDPWTDKTVDSMLNNLKFRQSDKKTEEKKSTAADYFTSSTKTYSQLLADYKRRKDVGNYDYTPKELSSYFAQASLSGKFKWSDRKKQATTFDLRSYIENMRRQEGAMDTLKRLNEATREQAYNNWKVGKRKPWDNGDGTNLYYAFMTDKERKRMARAAKTGKTQKKVAEEIAKGGSSEVSEQMLVSDAAIAATTANGGWVDVVKAVKKAIAAQKPGYSQSNYITIDVGTGDIKVRTDCSGFVSACLIAFGKLKNGTMLSSHNYSNKSDSNMSGTGFAAMDWPGWDALIEGDIIARSGHVEIFARNDGNTHYVYNCGGTDSVNSPDATRTGHSSYTTIWRCSDSSTSISLKSVTEVSGGNTLAGRLAALANAMTAPIKSFLYGDQQEQTTNNTTSNGVTNTSTSGNIELTGNDVAEKVWNYFKSLNYSDAAVAGIMGNLYQESRMDPTRLQGGDHGPAAGIAQWEDYDKRSSRWLNLNNRANKKGVPWTDLKTQLEFLQDELESTDMKNRFSGKTSPSNLSKAGTTAISFEDWKNTTDVENATRQFEAAFERAGTPAMDTRLSAANTYLSKYGGTAGTSISDDSSSVDTSGKKGKKGKKNKSGKNKNAGNGGFGGFGDSPSRVSKNYTISGSKAKPSTVYGGFGGTTAKPSGIYGNGSSTSRPSGIYGGFGAGDVSDVTNVADTSYMVNSDYIDPDKLPVQTKPNKTNKPKSTGYRNSGGYGQTISNGINNYNKKQSKMNKTDTDTMVNILTEMLAELKGTNVGINKFNDKEFNVNSPVYVSDTTNNNVVTKQDGETKKKSETIKKKASFIDKDSYSIAKKIASGRSYA